MQPARLETEAIQQRLRTRHLGRFLHLFEELASTNATAFTLAGSGATHGTAVLAEAQTAGKGRLGRHWCSPPHLNIYCSLILKNQNLSPHVPWIPLVTGLALAEATRRSCGIEISLKWPNDLLFTGKKIGGILCEGSSHGSQVSTCVVGFGVNVNCREPDFPEELRSLATSCYQATRQSHDRNDLIADMFNRLETWYDCVEAERFEHVRTSYAASCVTLGTEVEISCVAGETIRGTAIDIGKDGALLVSAMQEGKAHTLEIRSGDVHHLRRPTHIPPSPLEGEGWGEG